MTGFVEVGMQRSLRSELLQRRGALRAELQQVRTQLAANELWLRQHSILVKRHKAERVACEVGVSAGNQVHLIDITTTKSATRDSFELIDPEAAGVPSAQK